MPSNTSCGAAIRKSRLREGLPNPLGATWTGLGVNFALFSANATKVELCLFDDDGTTEIERIPLPEYTDEVWHGFLPDARPGTDPTTSPRRAGAAGARATPSRGTTTARRPRTSRTRT